MLWRERKFSNNNKLLRWGGGGGGGGIGDSLANQIRKILTLKLVRENKTTKKCPKYTFTAQFRPLVSILAIIYLMNE